MTRYRSEIGWPFGLLYAYLLWRLGWPLLLAILADGHVEPRLLAASLLTLGGLSYVAATTSYTITEESLVVRCGPLRSEVALGAIQLLRSTRNLVASPALSLRRIEVVSRRGPGLIISPADRVRFLQDLMSLAPHVRLEGLNVPGATEKAAVHESAGDRQLDHRR